MRNRHLRPVSPPSQAPLRFKTLARPRVDGLLHAALSARVGMVFGGPGSGKSVAVAHLFQESPSGVIRCAIPSSGGDVFTLAALLARAAAEHFPGIASTIEGACAEARRAPDPLASLSYWLGLHLNAYDGLIVVEDLHHAWSADARASQLLAKTIAGTPEACRWLIVARTACDLPVSSWVAYGTASMPVEGPDLAFTADEMGALAESIGASGAELDGIFALTDGWPAAATFALMTAARRPDAPVETATREMMYRFLAEQVLADLPQVDVDFMLDTCVFATLERELLRAAGISDALQRLDDLRSRVAFLQPLSHHTFRYHDLFRDFLLARLERDETRYRSNWQRAAQTYEARGEWEAALDAYRKVCDSAGARALLYRNGGDMIDRGRIDAVWNALETIDTSVDGTLLGLRAACAAARGEYERSDAWFERAIAIVSEPHERAELAWRFAADLMQRDPRRVIGVLAEYEACPPEDPRLATLTLSSAAWARWQNGDVAKAKQLIAQAVGLSVRVDDAYTRASFQHQASSIALLSGELGLAERASKGALELAQAHDLHGIVCRSQSALLEIAWLRDDMADALWWARQIERSAALSGNSAYMYFALAAQYDLEVDRWNSTAIERLDALLSKFDGLFFRYTTSAIAPAMALRAAMFGGFAQAYSMLEGTAERQTSTQRRAVRFAEIALYAAASGRRTEAEEAFVSGQRCFTESADAPVEKREARAHALFALAALLLGRESVADRSIRRLERIAPQLSPRFGALARTLRGLFVASQTNMLWDDLAADFGALSEAGFDGLSRLVRALPLSRHTPSVNFGSLTKTELRVVVALTETTSTRGIADSLNMSENTVKFHLKAINRKLGCRSRHEVVQKARARGIVSPP